jgi:toxin ParE1/3/4
MTKSIVITPKASADVDEHFAYLAAENLQVALLFFDSVRQTFAQIARMPGIGSSYPVENPRFQGLRKWSVKGFKQYLIFYLEHDESIEIVRVIHAKRDLERILLI